MPSVDSTLWQYFEREGPLGSKYFEREGTLGSKYFEREGPLARLKRGFNITSFVLEFI